MGRYNKKWTKDDQEWLTHLVKDTTWDYHRISQEMSRSYSAVQSRASSTGLVQFYKPKRGQAYSPHRLKGTRTYPHPRTALEARAENERPYVLPTSQPTNPNPNASSLDEAFTTFQNSVLAFIDNEMDTIIKERDSLKERLEASEESKVIVPKTLADRLREIRNSK